MAARFRQQELECMPRLQIAAFQEEKLKQSRLISRAYDSALYRSSWQKAGFAPASIQNRADLRQVPYLTGGGLRDAFATYAINDILTSQRVRFWFCTSGTTGSPKWIPYTDGDLDVCEQTILRSMWLIGMDQTRLTWLNLVTPAPFISDGAAHFGIFAEMLCGLQNEHIAASPTEVATSLPLASARKPNVLSAFPSVAARIAEGFPEAALVETRRRFQEKKNFANLAAVLLARYKGIRVRDIIKLRYGIFSGESLAPYRQTIIDWNRTSYMPAQNSSASTSSAATIVASTSGWMSASPRSYRSRNWTRKRTQQATSLKPCSLTKCRSGPWANTS